VETHSVAGARETLGSCRSNRTPAGLVPPKFHLVPAGVLFLYWGLKRESKWASSLELGLGFLPDSSPKKVLQPGISFTPTCSNHHDSQPVTPLLHPARQSRPFGHCCQLSQRHFLNSNLSAYHSLLQHFGKGCCNATHETRAR
jgi:hypothetical protein